MNEANARHTRITTRFFTVDVKELIDANPGNPDNAMAEMMVILESLQVGVMRTLVDVFHHRPNTAAEMAESCLGQALKRFTKPRKGNKP